MTAAGRAGDGRPALRLRAVVWDTDGTLVDSASVVPDAFVATIENAGGRTYERAEIVAAYVLGPPAALLASLLGRPATGADLDGYHARLRAAAHAVRPYPGVRAALADLAAAALPQAVFTGASSEAARILLGAAGLLDFLAAVVGGDQVGRPKPHPDGVVRACRELGVEPAEAAYVGAAPVDLEAAWRAGTLAVAAGWGHLHDPSALADLVLAAPGDLARLVAAGP